MQILLDVEQAVFCKLESAIPAQVLFFMVWAILMWIMWWLMTNIKHMGECRDSQKSTNHEQEFYSASCCKQKRFIYRQNRSPRQLQVQNGCDPDAYLVRIIYRESL